MVECEERGRGLRGEERGGMKMEKKEPFGHNFVYSFVSHSSTRLSTRSSNSYQKPIQENEGKAEEIYQVCDVVLASFASLLRLQ